jgi:hypothetical protein
LLESKRLIGRTNLINKYMESYKIDNPVVVTNNLNLILFSEEFSDVVIKVGGEGGSPSTRIPGH